MFAVYLWNTLKPSDAPKKFAKHNDAMLAIAFSPDGKLLASAGKDRVIYLNNLSGSLDKTIELGGHERSVNALASGPNGELLASGSNDATVRIWNVTRLDRAPIVFNHVDSVDDVAFNPGDPVLHSASDRRVWVWLTSTEVLANSVWALSR